MGSRDPFMVFREVGLVITAPWICLFDGLFGVSIGVALVVVLLIWRWKNNHDKVELAWQEVDKVIEVWNSP